MSTTLQETTDNQALRELRDAVKDLNKSTKFSSWVLIILTLVLIVLTVVLIFQGKPDFLTIKEFFFNYLNTLGLVCSLIGTLLIVFYIRKDPNEWVEDEGKPGDKWYALLIKHPRWLRLGVVLIVVGFFLSFLDSLFK